MERSVSFALRCVVVLCLAVSAQAVWAAAEKQGNAIRAEDERADQALTEERIDRMMQRLRDSDPSLAAELQQLRRKDAAAFRARMSRLMHERSERRAGAHGDQGRYRRQRKGSDRQMLRPGVGGQEHAGRQARRLSGPGRQMPRPEVVEQYLKWLKENYPEQAEELQQLRSDDPAIYRRKLILSFTKYQRIYETSRSNPELAEVLKQDLELKEQRRKLLRKIRTADGQAKTELTARLREVVAARYDLITRRKQLEYEQLLERLRRLQKELEESQAELDHWRDPDYKARNVEARVKELLGKSKDFKWD